MRQIGSLRIEVLKELHHCDGRKREQKEHERAMGEGARRGDRCETLHTHGFPWSDTELSKPKGSRRRHAKRHHSTADSRSNTKRYSYHARDRTEKE
jgi:hypothetical protein